MAVLSPKQIIERFNQLTGMRGNWEDHWQELAEFHMPNKATINSERTPGDKRNTQLLDNTGMKSLEVLASALASLLTNPALEFFSLTTGDLALDNNDTVRKWLQDSTTRMHNVLNNSNFQTEVHELYLDLALFGTSPMSIVEDDEKTVRFMTHSIDKFFIDEDNQGRVNEAYRLIKWNARQIVGEFGEDKLPPKIKKAFDQGSSQKFDIIHAIYPEDITKAGQSSFRFVSQHILREDAVELRQAKFREMPFVVPRWSKLSDEIYGRSPAMTSLPDMKTLNKMTETTIKGAQKVVDPPLQVPDDGFIQPIRVRPGSLNYFRAGTGDRIQPIFNDARIDFGFQSMDEKRKRVRDAFFIDAIILREGPQKTATEVLQIAEEGRRLLGPIIGRQQEEFLRPLIDRVFGIMLRREMFLPVPEQLEGRDLDVQYLSPIATAQRTSQAQNILRGLETMSAFFQVDPQATDNIDSDAAVQIVARSFNWPQDLIKNQDEVEAARQARAQAAQEQIQQEEAAQQADNVSKLAPVLQA